MCGIKKREPRADDPLNYLGIEFEFRLSKKQGELMKEELAQLPIADRMMLHYENLAMWFSDPLVMGWEATLLTHEDNFVGDLKEMLAFIQKWGGTVDETCGLHVHIDCRHRTMHGVASTLENHHSELFEFCAEDRVPSRVGFTNCGREGYKTVEVRCMEANFDLERIACYIGKLVGIVQGVPKVELPKYTLKVVRPRAVAAV